MCTLRFIQIIYTTSLVRVAMYRQHSQLKLLIDGMTSGTLSRATWLI